MLPIRDTIPRRQAALVHGLILANAAVFLITVLLGQGREAFLYRFGLVPAYWVVYDVSDLLRWPWLLMTLCTSQFLHGGIVHLGANMLYLWIFGGAVEERLGVRRFLLLYLGSGAVAALIQLWTAPGSSVSFIGASGSVAGILGAYFLLFPYARIVTLVPLVLTWKWKAVELPVHLYLGIWFLLQWLLGVAAIGQVPGIGGMAWWAHAGGFVCGLTAVAGPRRWRARFSASSHL